MLGNLQCPSDRRIQAFLDSTLKDVCPGGVAAASRPTRFCWTGPGSRG